MSSPKDDESAARERAGTLFQEAYRAQMGGDLERAVQLYKESIALWPTSEAHTFLGWTYSMQGLVDDAIAECEKAIEIDPEFGNPWNDIGAYYIQKNEHDKAIEYLERAKKAERYEARAFPYCNLARVWMHKGMMRKALGELEEAIRIDPSYKLARRLHEKVKYELN